MTPKLSDEQREAMHEQPGNPIVVVDDATQARFMLVPIEMFERWQASLFPEGFKIGETYPAQEQAALAAGWDDPLLDEYNDYDAHRPPS